MKNRTDGLSADDIGLIAAVLVLLGDAFAVWALLKARKEDETEVAALAASNNQSKIK